MVYSTGGEIEASDYNNLINELNLIFGIGNGDYGYGGNSTNVLIDGNIPDIIPGGGLTNEAWINLRNAIEDCADHQGTTLMDVLPSVADMEDGDVASFFLKLNSSQNLFDITTNRFLTDPTFNLPSTSSVLTDSRVLDWSTYIQHVFTIKFTSVDHARYFFNTGSTFRIATTRTGGAVNTQNAAWDSVVDGNDLIFGRDEYYALTGSLELVRSQITPLSGPYGSTGGSTGSVWTILGQRVGIEGPNGGNGLEIKIQSNFLDGHTNPPDIVDGTFTSSIVESKYALSFDIDSPTYTTNISLSNGN